MSSRLVEIPGRCRDLENRGFGQQIQEQTRKIDDFPRFFFYRFLVFPRLFLVFASISLAKNKKIQALVKFYVCLIQKFERSVPLSLHVVV